MLSFLNIIYRYGIYVNQNLTSDPIGELKQADDKSEEHTPTFCALPDPQ